MVNIFLIRKTTDYKIGWTLDYIRYSYRNKKYKQYGILQFECHFWYAHPRWKVKNKSTKLYLLLFNQIFKVRLEEYVVS